MTREEAMIKVLAKENDELKSKISELISAQESMLDKIRTEIKEWYWKADKQALAKDPCVVDAMVDLFIRTIDKHIANMGGTE